LDVTIEGGRLNGKKSLGKAPLSKVALSRLDSVTAGGFKGSMKARQKPIGKGTLKEGREGQDLHRSF